MDYSAFIVIGMVFGGFLSLLFFQMDGTWKKVVSFGLGNGSFLWAFFWLYQTLNLKVNMRTAILTYYFLAIMISFFLVCCYLFSKLKAQETRFKLKSLDILLGYKDVIKMYYNNRQKEIDKLLNYDDLLQENERLKSIETTLNQKDKQLREIKEVVDKACKDSICIELPNNNFIPVGNDLLSVFPSYIQDLVTFSSNLSLLTNSFIVKFPKFRGKESDWFKAYLLAVCTYTVQYLFDSQNVRVHFRYLDQEGNYSKLVACFHQRPFDGRLTTMPGDKGMIYEAGISRRSLIKSLNIDKHIPGKHDNIWVDYLTLVFEELYENGRSILSMGISVNNYNRYKNQLYFLNYCKFEKIIQQNLLKINERGNIIDLIRMQGEVV